MGSETREQELVILVKILRPPAQIAQTKAGGGGQDFYRNKDPSGISPLSVDHTVSMGLGDTFTELEAPLARPAQ